MGMDEKPVALVVHPAVEAVETFRRLLRVGFGIPAYLVSDKSIERNVRLAWKGVRPDGQDDRGAAVGGTDENGLIYSPKKEEEGQ